MSKRISKTKAQKIHFKYRVKQRYGLDINRLQRIEIIKMIQHGEAKFLNHQSRRVSKFIVEFKGTQMIVIYDKKRKTLVTALPINNQTQIGRMD